jgi:hypothetical protein
MQERRNSNTTVAEGTEAGGVEGEDIYVPPSKSPEQLKEGAHLRAFLSHGYAHPTPRPPRPSCDPDHACFLFGCAEATKLWQATQLADALSVLRTRRRQGEHFSLRKAVLHLKYYAEHLTNRVRLFLFFVENIFTTLPFEIVYFWALP